MIHETATLDAQGHLRGVTTRLVVEAASGFPDRYIAVYFGVEEPHEVSLGADLAAHLLSVKQGAASLELSWEWGGTARSRRAPSR